MHDIETIMSVNWIGEEKKKIAISNVKMVDNEEISYTIWNEGYDLNRTTPNMTFPHLSDRTLLDLRLRLFSTAQGLYTWINVFHGIQ